MRPKNRRLGGGRANRSRHWAALVGRPRGATSPANVIGFQTRGVAYWSEGTNGRILFGTNDGYLVAIDARTGAPISEFGNNGRVDLTTGIPGAERGKRPQLAAGESYYVSVNSPPIVVRDVVIVGSSMTDRPNLKEWPAGPRPGIRCANRGTSLGVSHRSSER